jgi:hypothetical protein
VSVWPVRDALEARAARPVRIRVRAKPVAIVDSAAVFTEFGGPPDAITAASAALHAEFGGASGGITTASATVCAEFGGAPNGITAACATLYIEVIA